MTKKLGVLLVDVPEPSMWEYNFIARTSENFFAVCVSSTVDNIMRYAYKCTQEEAKKYPQFRWVALEDL